jgi:hypothetical protein
VITPARKVVNLVSRHAGSPGVAVGRTRRSLRSSSPPPLNASIVGQTRRVVTDQDDIEAVRRALNAGMADSDIQNVLPIIVPRTYFEMGNWVGPYAYLRSQALGLTWTVLHSDRAMVYVNRERALSWEEDAIDWRERARNNLERLSSRQLWTHEKRDESGRVLWAAMMHDDGLGSARLLLRERLLSALEGDYQVGLPDRSCAVVVPLSAGHDNLSQASEMVRGMFQGATIPMLGDLLDPVDLELSP